MMHQLFSNSSTPLFQRAESILKLKPMSYGHFCQKLDIDPLLPKNFYLFSFVGGIPKYWNYVEAKDSPVVLVDRLFFSEISYLENEPDFVLKDENIKLAMAKSILNAIGFGAHKLSEIASRMGVEKTALSGSLIVNF